jgi:hypothetical protein
MSKFPFEELRRLAYHPANFSAFYTNQATGNALWEFLKRPENVVRMHAASDLERAAVEPLSAGLVAEFGPEIAEDQIKQMIGHMVRQIMEATGYEHERPGLRIARHGLFTSGARYRPVGESEGRRTMRITAEQRRAWLERAAKSPFNRWLDQQVRGEDGNLDLEKLYAVAKEWGIEKRYYWLNPGQQRMNIGVMLRALVPPEEYGGNSLEGEGTSNATP